MIEVEVRAFLHESMHANVREKLASMWAVKEGASLDVYYDTPEYRLLRHAQMVFLRQREGCLLQVKYDTADAPLQPPPCIEREFRLEGKSVPDEVHTLLQSFLPGWQSASTWQEVLRENHLAELARIEKHRSVYTDGLFMVCVDEVDDLGQFIEVEINLPEGTDTREAQEQVDGFLAEIGGTAIRSGYFEMYLYCYRHEAYQLVPPRFQVEEHLLPVHIWQNAGRAGKE